EDQRKQGGLHSSEMLVGNEVITSGVSLATPTAPAGQGSSDHDKDDDSKPGELPKEFVDSFAPVFRNSKQVRILHQFIYENTTESPWLVCLKCKAQIGPGKNELEPGENIQRGFDHFRKQHPELFEVFEGRLNKTGCSEDHEGMVRRHGGG